MGLLDPPSMSVAAAEARFLTQTAADNRYQSGALGPLYGYYAALTSAQSQRCNIYLIGDSIAEGDGAASVAARWASRTQDALRQRFQRSTIAGGMYVPGYYNSGPGDGSKFPAWTVAGSTALQSFGLGSRSILLNSGGTATITRYCTSVDLFLRNAAAQASGVTVSIDGGAAVAVNVNQIMNKWNSGPLAPGNHTFVVTWTANSPQVCGGFFYNGDETEGVAIWDGSKGGARADTWTSTADWARMFPLIPAALVVLTVLTNDSRTSSGGVSSAQYKTNLLAAVNTARTQQANVPILFMPPYQALGALIEPWDNYIAKLKEIVVATPYSALYDMSSRIPNLTGDPFGFLKDGVHPAPKGHAMMTSLATTALSPS